LAILTKCNFNKHE